MRLTIFATALICVCAINCIAQGSKQTSLPRIGEIKDYPATGLMTGCGNLYFFKAGAKMSDATYVFLARGDGSNAWMNLDGRDVRLRQVKSTTRNLRKPRRYYYVYGQTRVNVLMEDFKPKADGSESEHMYKMTITVRKAGAVRIVHAVGDADC
jgi:hypothetical protein